ncbi:MAG: DUF4364 family protein [Clostridia bacterium]|nr:DUF4364 family protein [Clostridia bacterium]
MSSDTFSEGIVPGGLREKNEIKLLVCYLLKTLKRSLTRTQINEILSEYSVANYFEVNGAVSELISGGQVISEISDGDELVTLTAKAELDVAAIERTLPRTVREKSVAAALKILSRERIIKESNVDITPLEHGYHVSFSVKDMDTEMLKITVYVPDESQLETVKKNFFNNAVSIYSEVISSLTTR